MRRLASVVLTGGLVLGAATVASARCEDAAAVAAARAAAAGPCNCALATNHGDYVSCVADFAQTFPGLPSNCRGEVVRCAAHSTCGKKVPRGAAATIGEAGPSARSRGAPTASRARGGGDRQWPRQPLRRLRRRHHDDRRTHSTTAAPPRRPRRDDDHGQAARARRSYQDSQERRRRRRDGISAPLGSPGIGFSQQEESRVLAGPEPREIGLRAAPSTTSWRRTVLGLLGRSPPAVGDQPGRRCSCGCRRRRSRAPTCASSCSARPRHVRVRVLVGLERR